MIVLAGSLVGWAHFSVVFAADGPDSAVTVEGDVGAAGYAEFDRALLPGGGQGGVDLSRFERGNPVSPGRYRMELYLNNAWVSRGEVNFVAASANTNASPCVNKKLIDQLGLTSVKLSDESKSRLQDPTACVSIGSLIPDATMQPDMSELRLDVSVPQAVLGQMPRGYVSPENWDEGVPAGLLNYNLNSYRSDSQGVNQTTTNLGLNAGINIGPWHFRQDSTVNWQSTESGPSRHEWQDINSYVQRDLPSLRSNLTIGDSYTSGQIFDSIGLRGAQLATDDRMLPDSQRGYAPVVRGTAYTNALVTVRQNGVQIYQTTVAPGPFAIDDLYPTGYGGDLDITVEEADGRIRKFSTPYASVPQLLRPGSTHFSVAAGQLRNASTVHKADVVQATLQHGFNNLLTGYTGVQASQGYTAALIGSGVNTPFGALAADITQARAEIPGSPTQSGQSARLSYSNILPKTGTSFTIATYRYSTDGYLSLTDAALARDYASRGFNAFTDYVPPALSFSDGIPVQDALYRKPIVSPAGLRRQRNRFSTTVNQQLGGQRGSLYVNATATNYWNAKGTDQQFQLGYNNNSHRLSYGISATRSRDQTGRYDNEYAVSLSIPFGDGPHAPSFMSNLTRDQNGGSQEQLAVSGAVGADNQYNYGVSTSRNADGAGNTSQSSNLNGSYRGPYGVLSTSFGSGSGYSQTSLGMSGAVVAHPGGVTFGQSIGDTVGIVSAAGADGARLESSVGAQIDPFGYALVPYLTPYSLNKVSIDPKGLPLDLQLDTTSAQVAPHAGAVVMLKFDTVVARTVLVHTHFANGDAVPFGAEVLNEKDVSIGVVGQAGQILARGVNDTGRLVARWQDDHGKKRSCSFEYQLKTKSAKKQTAKQFEQINATCA